MNSNNLLYLQGNDVEITSEGYLQSGYSSHINFNGLSFIFYYLPTCSYCLALKPIFEHLSTIFSNCKFFFLDVSKQENSHIVNANKIPHVPFLVMHHNGRILSVYNSYRDFKNLKYFIEQCFAQTQQNAVDFNNPFKSNKSEIPVFTTGVPKTNVVKADRYKKFNDAYLK